MKHIRAVGFEEEYYTADALDMLANLADGTYEGLSAEGLAGEEPIPVLDGKITVHSKFYQDSVEELRKIFNKLELVMDGEAAIRFADAEVLRVLLNATVGTYNTIRKVDKDGDGMLTEEELSSLTTLSDRNDNVYSMFRDNTVIETFNEFQYFSGLEFINSGSFSGCSSLKEIILPMLTKIGTNVFQGSGIEKLIIPEGYQLIGDSLLQNCPNLKLVDFPTTVTSISSGGSLFWAMKNQVTVICRATTPPALRSFGYNGDPKVIYVPDASVDAYKSADGWNSQSGKIYPLSVYEEL